MKRQADVLGVLMLEAENVNESENDNAERNNPRKPALPLEHLIADFLDFKLLRKVLDVLVVFEAQLLFGFDLLHHFFDLTFRERGQTF